MENIFSSLKVRPTERILSGKRCKNVFRVRNIFDQSLVLKFASDEMGHEEIKSNLQGYSQIREIGLINFIPKIFEENIQKNCSYILMEDCGDSLAAQLLDTAEYCFPIAQFCKEMFDIYSRSNFSGPQGMNYISTRIKAVKHLYEDVKMHLNGSEELKHFVQGMDMNLSAQINFYSFSSWDFMPGNIFVNEHGIKFIDPTASVVGMPIIDLACFAGVLKDLYQRDHVEEIRLFCHEELAKLYNLSDKNVRKIFCLGQIIQTLLHFRSISGSELENSRYTERLYEYFCILEQ